jgi:hypothetical protein
MSFFKQFPKTTYDLKQDGNRIEIKDIFRNVDVNEKLINPASAYQYYYIQDGERPDQIANKLYSNPRYYWTLFVANDRLKDGYMRWPLSYQQLQRKIREDYNPYIVIELSPYSVTTLGKYANPISSLSFGVSNGLFSGDADTYTEIGTGYKFDSERYQLWLKPSSNDTARKFRNFLTSGRDIPAGVSRDRGDGTNVPVLSLRFNTTASYDVVNSLGGVRGWGAAWQAPYYYKGSDGGRLTTYDAVAAGAVSNPYTYSEYLEDENQKLTAIRVVKPNYIAEFAEVYKEYVNS